MHKFSTEKYVIVWQSLFTRNFLSFCYNASPARTSLEGLQSFSPSLCPLARFQISLMFHNFSFCNPQHSHSKPEAQATVLYPLTHGRHHWESICFKNGIKSKNDTIFNISLRKSISSKQLAVTYCSVGSAVSLPSSTCVVQRRLHCDVTRWGQRTVSGRGCWCEGTQCCDADVRGAGSTH